MIFLQHAIVLKDFNISQAGLMCFKPDLMHFFADCTFTLNRHAGMFTRNFKSIDGWERKTHTQFQKRHLTCLLQIAGHYKINFKTST